MSQKLPADGFKWFENISQFSKDFIEDYNEDSHDGYFLEVDVQYPEKLRDLHNDLPFLREKKRKMEKLKTCWHLHDKKQHIIHIKNLDQVLHQGLVFKKMHRIIKFSKKSWLKSYTDMNSELRKNAKSDFEKHFFKLMNNAVFEKNY